MSPTNQLREISPGFWNVRVPFKIFKIVDIGTHMSVIKLSNDKFLVVDTVEMNEEVKKQFDELTENGTKIEAVIGTHPFHTLAFPGFHKLYPDAPFYGTPRHVRRITEIPWAGTLNNEEKCLARWAPDVQLRIPDGAEYINPLPEKTNHFISVFVYHSASKTLHVDDTLMYAEDPGILMRLIGVKAGKLMFHPSMKSEGLLPTPEAPLQFRDWMRKILADWEFDTLATAHLGILNTGAHAAVTKLVDDNEELFQKLHDERTKNPSSPSAPPKSPEKVPDLTVSGNECG